MIEAGATVPEPLADKQTISLKQALQMKFDEENAEIAAKKKERNAERCRKWYQQNKEKKAEYNRLRYEQNKEKILEYNREYNRRRRAGGKA